MRSFFLLEDPNDLYERYGVAYHNSCTNRTVFVGEWHLTIQGICNQDLTSTSTFTFDTSCKIDLDDYLKLLRNNDLIIIPIPCLPYPEILQDYPELLI